jgi:hypothetical protein
MPTEEDIIQLTFRAVNEKELQAAIAAIDAAVLRLQTDLQSGLVPNFAAWEAATDRLVAAKAQATAKLAEFRSGVVRIDEASAQAAKGAGALGQVLGRGGNFGMGVLYASQAVEDLQYGFRAIVNNIPQIVLGFGGTAGLAGVVSLTAVGINVLSQHMGDLWRQFGGNPVPKATESLHGMEDELRAVTTALDKFRQQQTLTDDELERFNKLIVQEGMLKARVETLQTIDRLRKDRTEDDRKRADIFRKALGDTQEEKPLENALIDILKHRQSRDAAGKVQVQDFQGKMHGSAQAAAQATIAEMDKGNAVLFEEIPKLLQSYMGKGKLRLGDILLSHLPVLSQPVMEAHVEAWKKFNAVNVQGTAEFKQRVEALNREGQAGFEDFLKQTAGGAIDGVRRIYGGPLRDLAAQLRGEGDPKGISILTDQIRAKVLELSPILAEFPRKLEEAVRIVRRGVVESIDESIRRLKAEEGLTEQEARRRLAEGQKGKRETQQEKRAEDLLGEAAGAERERQRALFPEEEAPSLTEAQKAEAGKKERERMAGLGLTPEEQAGVARARTGKGGEGAGALRGMRGEAGFGEADALRRLPQIMDLINQGAGAEQALGIIQNQLERRGRQQANQGERARRTAENQAEQFGAPRRVRLTRRPRRRRQARPAQEPAEGPAGMGQVEPDGVPEVKVPEVVMPKFVEPAVPRPEPVIPEVPGEAVGLRSVPPDAAATTAKIMDNEEALVRAVGTLGGGVDAASRRLEVLGRQVAALGRAAHATSNSLLNQGYDYI